MGAFSRSTTDCLSIFSYSPPFPLKFPKNTQEEPSSCIVNDIKRLNKNKSDGMLGTNFNQFTYGSD